jgi:hypothetical protein
MTIQHPDQDKAAPESTDSKIFESDKSQSNPEPNNPMNRFNNALRKILSVPKKNLKKK